MNKITKTEYPDYSSSGMIDTAHSTIKLVKADNFIRQHKTKNWKHFFKIAFNHSDFYIQRLPRTKKLIVRSDFECLTKQQHSIKICP